MQTGTYGKNCKVWDRKASCSGPREEETAGRIWGAVERKQKHPHPQMITAQFASLAVDFPSDACS